MHRAREARKHRAASPSRSQLQEPYTSPVPPALYPQLTLTLLAAGIFFLANFFVFVM